jgi:hypothetical protein
MFGLQALVDPSLQMAGCIVRLWGGDRWTICVGVPAKEGCLSTIFDLAKEDFRSVDGQMWAAELKKYARRYLYLMF